MDESPRQGHFSTAFKDACIAAEKVALSWWDAMTVVNVLYLETM